jgi:integrase
MARIPKPWFRDDRQAYFVTINGVRHNLGANKKAAERQYHELMAQVSTQAPVIPKRTATALTVGQVFEKYLDWCQQHRSPRTYEWTQKHIQRFCDHLKNARTMLTGELRPFHVMEWVESKKTWGANQKRGAIIAVSRPFNWAAKLGYIENSPVRGVEKPTPEKRQSRMTPADFEMLFSHVKDTPFRELLTFAYEAGCRPQEARLIEARHLKLDYQRIEIPPQEAKGKKRWRVIYLSDKAVEIVSRLAQLRPAGPLFLNVDNNPWKAQAIVSRFQRLLVKLAGLHVTIPPLPRFDRRRFKDPALLAAARKEHQAAIVAQRRKRAKIARQSETRFAMYDLRHCFATRKLKEGHDPITVAALLGHKDATMLCRHYEEISRDGDHLRMAVN